VKRIVFNVVAGTLAVVIVLVGLELLATGYLLVRDRRYTPARARLAAARRNTFIDMVTAGSSGCRYVDTLFPHPYLAFVHHGNAPCGVADVNNIGLFGRDFPSEKPGDKFVVLVTGGSVAAQFMRFVRGGPSYLEAALNRDYDSPTGRPFWLLNGGDGAWKQPQQLFLFLLYADAVDAVVTLDGFNEHFMLGGFMRFEYPANNFAFVNPMANSDFSDVVKRWMAARVFTFATGNPILSRSQAVYLVLARIDQYLRETPAAAVPRKTTVESMFALPGTWSKEQRIGWTDAQYQKYIRAMDAVAAQHHVLTAHFIQPAPAIGKVLTPEERTLAEPLDYAALYQRMTRDLMQLQSDGTPIFSLLDVFNERHDTLYADKVHVHQDEDGTSEGYRLIAERIARQLGETWQLERKKLASVHP